MGGQVFFEMERVYERMLGYVVRHNFCGAYDTIPQQVWEEALQFTEVCQTILNYDWTFAPVNPDPFSEDG